MKVLHLINELSDEGGAQRIALELAREARGTESSILSIEPVEETLAATLADQGVAVSALKPWSLGRFRRGRELARRADLLQVHLFPALYLALCLPGPRVFTEHNTRNARRERRWLRPLERCVYRRYARLVCISEATRAALAAWVGEHPGLRVIENGVRLERFEAPARARPSAPFTLAMTGSFTRQKDQATLLRALALLPLTYRLLLIGDGPLRAPSERLASALGVAERVEFAGWVAHAELPSRLTGVDLYVQSSHWEGFGLAPVEALAAGVPALGSDVPGLAQVLGDPRLLFAPGDAQQLARLARRLLEQEDYAARSRAALKRARAFDGRRMARAYQELWREVLGPGSDALPVDAGGAR